MSNYEYTVRILMHNDMPSDVLVEHIGYALRGIVDPTRRKSWVSVEILDKKSPRQHPFEGPEVNDDEPIKYARGGFVSGDASTSMVAGDSGYYLSAEQIAQLGGEALRKIVKGSDNAEVVFSGPNRDEWTPDAGIVARVPEELEEVTIEIDLEDIVDQVYRAIGEDFPHLSELFRAKREEHEVKRNREITDPPAEGDWQLEDEDNVGDDL